MLRFFEERHGLEIRSSLFFSYQKTLDFFEIGKTSGPNNLESFDYSGHDEVDSILLFDLFHGLFLVLENVSSMIGFVKTF